MNFKNDYNLIEVGGANQPTENQVKDFIVDYSNKMSKVEISGYGIGYNRSDKIDAVLIEPHKDNKYDVSYSLRFQKNTEIQKHKSISHLENGERFLQKNTFIHIHP